MKNRRGFLGGMLAAAAAPAFGAAALLTPVKKIAPLEFGRVRVSVPKGYDECTMWCVDPSMTIDQYAKGQCGFIDAKFYYRAVELNEGWMT